MTSILVVDPNEAFATLLSEELQRQGYDVRTFYSGGEALTAARKRMPDLAVLDMALEDPSAIAMAQELRGVEPRLRLMLIPLMGETLVPEAEALSVQGVLTKPFFIPDLPDMIGAALQAPVIMASAAAMAEAPVEAKEEPPAVSAEVKAPVAGFSAGAFEAHRKQIQSQMADLMDELGAEGVVLTNGETLVAWLGRMDEAGAAVVGRTVTDCWKSSAEVARIIGSPQTRIEMSISGDDYTLYALSVTGDVILTVGARGAGALGLLRHRARRTASALEKCCVEA